MIDMNIAFIGVGGIATRYLKAIDAMADIRVAAVCDLNEARAREVAEPLGAAVYTDHHELYRQGGFEAVLICIPPFAHTDQETMAVERNIHLFVAKPVALTMEKTAEVERVLQGRDIVHQSGYMWRYADITDKALELIGNRRIALVEGQVWTGVPKTPWWWEKAKSGGQVVEQASHIYDLVRLYAGDVESLTAYGSRGIARTPVDFEDVISAVMKHTGGAISHVSSTCGAPDVRFELNLIGEGFRLNMNYGQRKLTGKVDEEKIDFKGDIDGYDKQLETFFAAIRGRDKSLVRSSYDDAAKSLRLTLAVNESIEQNKEIRLGSKEGFA
jgi:predicted dehydrogenase